MGPYWGTESFPDRETHYGLIFIGRDPETGDRLLLAIPPEPLARSTRRPEFLVIEPEIIWPPWDHFK
ncbi:MAG: hypothetical protein ACLFTB_00805 [Desulfovibrionales bacterium]